MACIAEFGKGNFEAELEKFPGKKAFINGTIEKVRENLKSLIADTNMLAKAAVEGKLATRADTSKHQGDFQKIVQGVNDTLDAVIGPLNVAAEYVDRISKGDIPPKITDSYNGDFNVIKNNINTLIERLSEVVANIKTAADNVASGSQQMSSSTQEMSQGATEQAASAEASRSYYGEKEEHIRQAEELQKNIDQETAGFERELRLLRGMIEKP